MKKTDLRTTDTDPAKGNYTLFYSLIEKVEKLELEKTDPQFVQQLTDVVGLYNNYSSIEPCDMFYLGFLWTRIAERKGLDSGLLSRAATLNAGKPRPGSRKWPLKEELASKLEEFIEKHGTTYGAKTWLANCFEVRIDVITRAAEKYDLDLKSK